MQRYDEICRNALLYLRRFDACQLEGVATGSIIAPPTVLSAADAI